MCFVVEFRVFSTRFLCGLALGSFFSFDVIAFLFIAELFQMLVTEFQ